MITILWIIIGGAAAAALLWCLRKTKAGTHPKTYANMLVIAAIIYVGFAFFGGALEWAYIEVIGVVIFAAIAAAGLKFSYWLLAVGWAAHVLWDVLLHSPETTPFVPFWYPAACIGFDLVLAGYIAAAILSNNAAANK